MKKLLLIALSAFALNVQADDEVTLTTYGPQLTNAGFENWDNASDRGYAPDNWNSFGTATGTYASAGYNKNNPQVGSSAEVRPGTTGKSSAVIWARNVIVAIAQGNMTTGRVNAGAMKATNEANYNQAHVTDSDTYPYSYQTVGTISPKAIRFWAKFVPKTSTDQARVSATLHKVGDYITYGQDSQDTDTNKALAVQRASKNFTATYDENSKAQWVQYTINFGESTEDIAACTGSFEEGETRYIMVNFATNYYPGGGSAGDSLYIDDIELLYDPADYPESTLTYTDDLTVNVYSMYFDPAESTIELEQYSDGTSTFVMKNFILGDLDDDGMAVGNVTVSGITPVLQDDGSYKISGTYTAVLSDGDAEGVDTWYGAILNSAFEAEGGLQVTIDATYTTGEDGKMVAKITMDLGDLGPCYVWFGCYPEITLNETAEVSTTAVKADVTVNRTLKAGWNSIMLPFAVDATDIAEGAYFATYDGSEIDGTTCNLNFSKATSLSANTPALLHMPSALSSFTKEGVTVVEASAGTVKSDDSYFSLVGVYSPMTSSNSSIVAGDYGVNTKGIVLASGGNAINSMSAYLKAKSAAQSVRMVVDGDEATAIEAVEMVNALTDGEAYDLTGRKANSNTKGIVIVNGKKVVR